MSSGHIEFEEEIYDVGDPMNLDLSLHSGFDLFDNWSNDKEPVLPNTDHMLRDLNLPKQSKEASSPEPSQGNRTFEREPKIIEVPLRCMLATDRARMGKKGETKNLEKIFKTEILTFLKIMRNSRVLNQNEWSQVKQLKQKNWCFAQLGSIITQLPAQQQLREFFSSPSLIHSLMGQDKLTIHRKIEVLRHLEMMRKILNSYNVRRWKQP